MRTRVLCTICAIDYQKRGLSHEPDCWMPVELGDERTVLTACPRGHKINTILHIKKYELLFDIGIYAYLDGYFREAVASIATAQERLNEHFIMCICHKHKIPFAAMHANWKNVANQSERQMGAFCFLFLLDSKKPAKIIKANVELRNDVVHKGYIPTNDKTPKYIKIVYNEMQELLSYLQNECGNASLFVHTEKFAGRIKSSGVNESTDSGDVGFLRNLLIPNKKEDIASFDEKLQFFMTNPRWLFP